LRTVSRRGAAGRRRELRPTAVLVSLTALTLVAAGLVSCRTGGGAAPSARPEGLRLAGEPDLRVRIVPRTDAVRLRTENGAGLRLTDPDGGAETIAVSGAVRVAAGGRGFEVEAPGVGRGMRAWAVVARGDHPIVVETSDSAITVGETVELRRVATGAEPRFDVIATLPMERYLVGVLAGELYASWEPAAYEAQAIAARSYALHERRRSRAAGRRYDIEGSALDQVFAGAVENRTARDAVRATRGMVLLDGPGTARALGTSGALRAYYSSTCGGRGADAAGIWPVTPETRFNLAEPLNAEPDSLAQEVLRGDATHRMTTGDLIDAWAAARPGDDGSTAPASAPARRLDYVYAVPGAAEPAREVLWCERWFLEPEAGVHASAHLGVLCTFEE